MRSIVALVSIVLGIILVLSIMTVLGISIPYISTLISREKTAMVPIYTSRFRGEYLDIAVNNTYLVIELYRGFLHSVCFYRVGASKPSLCVYVYGTPKDYVLAREALVSLSHSVWFINLGDIISALRESNVKYDMIVYSGYGATISRVGMCRVSVRDSSLYIGFCKEFEKPVVPDCSRIKDYSLERILCVLNRDEIEYAGKTILGSAIYVSVTEIVWKAIEWVDKHIEYDEVKARSSNGYIYSPSETISLGKGVCIDYAVLYTAALLYADISPVYIVNMYRDENLHSVAMIYINGTGIVLEQHLPPIELADYIQYNNVSIYELLEIHPSREGVFIKIINRPRIRAVDTYPKDSLPSNLAQDIMLYLHRKYGVNINPKLEAFIDLGIYGYIEYPSARYYSKIFRFQWMYYLVEDIWKTLTIEWGKKPSDLWIVIENYTVKIAYSEVPLPNITIELVGEYLVITIESQSDIKDIDVIIADPTTKQDIAGITRRPYYYKNLITIYADQWIVESNKAKIVVSIYKIVSRIQRDKFYIKIWLETTTWNKPYLVYVELIDLS